MPSQRILIVGASLAGLSVAERLRERGSDCEIVLVGDEVEAPYNRPPLSKQFLSHHTPFPEEKCQLRPASWYLDHQIEVQVGNAAASLDAGSNRLVLADGRKEFGDHVVIATGARARQIAAWGQPIGLYYLRTLADARALKDELANPREMVVVGGGFIGLEVSASAKMAGWNVTLVEAGGAPLGRLLPPKLAAICTEQHALHGVRILTGVGVEGVDGTPAVRSVRLTDGRILPADAVVVGAGAIPNIEWLAGSSITQDKGIVCDDAGRTSRPSVWAAGDVAQWTNPQTGRADRVEQWQTARDHGKAVADAILGDDISYSGLPSFWSDAFGSRIQFVGQSSASMSAHTVRDNGRVVSVVGQDRLEGVFALSHPRSLAAGKQLLTSGASYSAACAWADSALSDSHKSLLPVAATF